MKLSSIRVPLPVKFCVSIALPLLAGAIGSYFTQPEIAVWYSELEKAAFTPPNWAFGIIWNVLFVLMGIALFIVWKKGWNKAPVRLAVKIFIIQLMMNIVWSVIFFGMHSTGPALLEIISLWLAILATILVFYRVSKVAAWLMVPYITWVSFATYLNYYIWAFN